MQSARTRVRRPWRALIGTVGVGVLVLSLSACQSETGAQTEPSETTATTLGESGQAAGGTQMVSFDEEFRFPDGISVKLADPEPVEGMATEDGTQAVKMDVTIANSGENQFSTSDVKLTITSGGEMGKMLGYETAEPLELPYSPLEPGKSNTISVGFTVKDPDDMRVILQFSDGRNSVTFIR